MKKLFLYIFSILLFFVNSHAFDVDLKVTLTCSLSAKNNKDFVISIYNKDDNNSIDTKLFDNNVEAILFNDETRKNIKKKG